MHISGERYNTFITILLNSDDVHKKSLIAKNIKKYQNHLDSPKYLYQTSFLSVHTIQEGKRKKHFYSVM